MFLIPNSIPASADNYLWWLHNGKGAVVVDPGDARPVLRSLEERALPLKPILVTHRHADHTTDVDGLRDAIGTIPHGRVAMRLAQTMSLWAYVHPNVPGAIIRGSKIKPFMSTRQATIMAAVQRLDASVHGDTCLFAAIRQ